MSLNSSYKLNKMNSSQLDRLNRLTDKLNNVFIFINNNFLPIEYNGLPKEFKIRIFKFSNW